MTGTAISKPEMGYNGLLQFGVESSYGKAVDATRRLAYVRPSDPEISNSLDTERFLANNGRDIPTPLMGNLDIAFSFEQRASEMTLLKYVLGTVSSSTGAPTYTHTLTPANTVKSLTMWTGLDTDTNRMKRLGGCKIGRYSLSGSEGAPWVERFDMIVSHPKYSTTVTSLSQTTVRPFEWFDSKFEWSYEGSTYTEIPHVRGFEMVYDNDLRGERYLATYDNVPKRCINACHEGVRAYALTLTKDFTDITEFTQFLGSSTAAATTPKVTPKKGKLKLTLTRSATDNVVVEFTSVYIDNPGWRNPDAAGPVQYNLVMVGETLGSVVVTNTTASFW